MFSGVVGEVIIPALGSCIALFLFLAPYEAASEAKAKRSLGQVSYSTFNVPFQTE